MERQTLRDWVLRYNEHGVDGLFDRWNGGRPPTFTAEEQAQLVEIVLAGPDSEVSGHPAFAINASRSLISSPPCDLAPTTRSRLSCRT